jgi:hypothetical protein
MAFIWEGIEFGIEAVEILEAAEVAGELGVGAAEVAALGAEGAAAGALFEGFAAAGKRKIY